MEELYSIYLIEGVNEWSAGLEEEEETNAIHVKLWECICEYIYIGGDCTALVVVE